MSAEKIKSILVDDEPRGITSLQKLLEINCEQVQIVATCNSGEDAIVAINTHQPNLVFLDIAMPGITGFEMLKEFKEIRFEIIFITAHNEYALQAFHFSAVDYLLKPVDADMLTEAVKRAIQKTTAKTHNKNLETLLFNTTHVQVAAEMKLCIPSLKGFQIVCIKEIIYCEATSNYTNFYLTGQRIICASKPIHEYEILLEDAGFLRVHKSFLVNIIHITEYQRGEGGIIVLTNNNEVEVSRRKKEYFINKMKAYYKY
jgi:two-component system, LytTR family, response regulator